MTFNKLMQKSRSAEKAESVYDQKTKVSDFSETPGGPEEKLPLVEKASSSRSISEFRCANPNF